MEIIAIKTWDEVSIKLNNHETLLLLQSLKDDTEDIRKMVASKLQNNLSPDMKYLLETVTDLANEKVRLHNELLPCFRSDYEHLMLEPIELK